MNKTISQGKTINTTRCFCFIFYICECEICKAMADAKNIVELFEDFDYKPSSSTKVEKVGEEIPIIIFSKDIITQPSKSCLILLGKVDAMRAIKNADNTMTRVYIPINHITEEYLLMVNNGFLHLFDRIDYYIGDTKVDSVCNPGITTTMKGLVSFENDFKLNKACWKIKNDSRYQSYSE